MKILNLTKLAVALPLMAYAGAANAEIAVDAQNNVSYSGLAIAADGSAMVDGTAIGKCEGNEAAKVTRAKLATLTCDADFVKLRDKKGNELTRYSGYAKANAGGVEERKLFDQSLAKMGSGTTGAAALSQSTVVENKKTITTKTVTLEPGPGYLGKPRPQPATIDQKNYTPKLGTMASKTPAITKKNTPAEAKDDRAVAKAEKEAKSAPPGATNNMTVTEPEIIIRSTEPSDNVEQTTKTTTTIKPVPSAEAKGATQATTVKTKTETIPAPFAAPVPEPKKEDKDQPPAAN
jgi:hypothetical protein